MICQYFDPEFVTTVTIENGRSIIHTMPRYLEDKEDCYFYGPPPSISYRDLLKKYPPVDPLPLIRPLTEHQSKVLDSLLADHEFAPGCYADPTPAIPMKPLSPPIKKI